MIRKHLATDLEQIMHIWYESSTLAHPFLNSAFVEKVKLAMRTMYIPDSDTWVFENESEVVGFISMMDNEIGGLFVLPQHHSKGIGSKLVNHVSTLYQNLEVEVFEKNEIGRAFYYKYGFSEVNQFFHAQSGERVLRLMK